jgi:acyl-coenzyme A thioesterase PaaI-like protein
LSEPDPADPTGRTGGDAIEPWRFGESPLAEGVEVATVLRDLIGTVLSLEASSPELAAVLAELRAARETLAKQSPPDLRPRVGPDATADRRVYLDHSRAIGDYNPCFPRYELTCADDRGTGTVEFPVAYEGPPGIVHGGFLAVFFDCVLQQLNCDLGLTGRTSDLAVRYRRPTPILTPLEVHAERAVEETRIRSSAELRLDDTVLCRAEMHAVVGDRTKLPAVSPRFSAR